MKTILITGSTDGIGKLAAIKLAKDGHTVYIHGRSSEKVSNVISEIKEVSGNINIDGFVADFSDLEAVKKMASEVKERLVKLDVLINNAGVFKSKINQNAYGDIRMVVNYFAPYILTNELLPILEDAETSRVINLSSAAQAPVNIEVVKGAEVLNVNSAYAQSKLALTMWTFDLANRVKNTTAIAVNPGSLLNTRMVQEAFGQHWSSADKGATILYDLAVASIYEKETGKYFDNDKGDPKGTFGVAHIDAYDKVKIEELIKTTNKVLNI
ncbi:SDR family NAD(P)-dependent oxidoreductase [uncultured Tenacibaculum sp.]|uniref:SDR family NAD(P)-dependent oxidoreductase n=1 Tax=uncultured Tenacibaculum sp. TaxID=174713 RepID=UPI00262A6EBF|nr:SDR family NAD(P)-dependent oxidoreductase [uncultured Tenacibaculum sp.]